ncbi:FIGL1 protein, partial [Polyodon spathula]|nr:FIGL1 protein [Polyodon spathula]
MDTRVLRNMCYQPSASFHPAGPPCSHLRATASEDHALGNLQAGLQAPNQSTGVTATLRSTRDQHFLAETQSVEGDDVINSAPEDDASVEAGGTATTSTQESVEMAMQLAEGGKKTSKLQLQAACDNINTNTRAVVNVILCKKMNSSSLNADTQSKMLELPFQDPILTNKHFFDTNLLNPSQVDRAVSKVARLSDQRGLFVAIAEGEELQKANSANMSSVHLNEWQKRSFDVTSGTYTPEQKADVYSTHILDIQYAWANSDLSEACTESLFRKYTEKQSAIIDSDIAETRLNNYAVNILHLARCQRNDSDKWESSLTTESILKLKCVQEVSGADDSHPRFAGSSSTNRPSKKMNAIPLGTCHTVITNISSLFNDRQPNAVVAKWDDIAGLEFAKATIKEIVVWPMLRPDIFTGLIGLPKGNLLFGPPGTGKTLIGKCIASQSGAALGPIQIADISTIPSDQVRAVVYTDFKDALQTVRPSLSSKDLKLYEDWNKTFGCSR